MAAQYYGADAIGFVFWKKSPRFISPGDAGKIIDKLSPFITTVGVFVDERPEKINEIIRSAGLGCVQLHGGESPDDCLKIESRIIKAVRIKEGADIGKLKGYSPSAFLLDTYREGVPGGTGESFNWDIAVLAKEYGRIILSGGLNPENVVSAISKVRPYGVDVSSGVEARPGRKDPRKISEFIKRVREIEEEI
ncbi:MAG: phosphoribosylanthranilate isomerase [Deltaproteobacteria bacterium]|nr:phosphoribosylanthranilate isomerase [Deltaproteobacteria bacterium]